MIFSNAIIGQLKDKSGLQFDRAADFSTLAALISNTTKHSIGVTTLKRLFGYIEDERETNQSTLNLVARYLGLLLSGKKRQNHIFSTNITSYTCFTKKGLSFEAM